ncbi:hypothetical protein UFOVP601_32 [uncultured Caudovirales phage]|uniref:Uncharacterized protein n=1 Tax=uncultured Caudovirales phage TaxID=2100421 RepID=A0A6J5MWT3_9CAUD|nr:hypothetical protein UFOVP601_32 [uncultured Caudovirales phage]
MLRTIANILGAAIVAGAILALILWELDALY